MTAEEVAVSTIVRKMEHRYVPDSFKVMVPPRPWAGVGAGDQGYG